MKIVSIPQVLSGSAQNESYTRCNVNDNALHPLVSNAQRQVPLPNYVFNNHLQSNTMNTTLNECSLPGAYHQFLPQPATRIPTRTSGTTGPTSNYTFAGVDANTRECKGKCKCHFINRCQGQNFGSGSSGGNHGSRPDDNAGPNSLQQQRKTDCCSYPAPYNNRNNVVNPVSNGHGQIEQKQPNIFHLHSTENQHQH